jgi:hypothetical protein
MIEQLASHPFVALLGLQLPGPQNRCPPFVRLIGEETAL